MIMHMENTLFKKGQIHFSDFFARNFIVKIIRFIVYNLSNDSITKPDELIQWLNTIRSYFMRIVYLTSQLRYY